MWETEFSDRLCKLRTQKKVSARDMSLSLGQSPGYINRIENRKALPSMSSFFAICEFLGVTPAEFLTTRSMRQSSCARPSPNCDGCPATSLPMLQLCCVILTGTGRPDTTGGIGKQQGRFPL